jgi:hypothetical protein
MSIGPPCALSVTVSPLLKAQTKSALGNKCQEGGAEVSRAKKKRKEKKERTCSHPCTPPSSSPSAATGTPPWAGPSTPRAPPTRTTASCA